MKIVVNCIPPKNTHQASLFVSHGRIIKKHPKAENELIGLFYGLNNGKRFEKAIKVKILWAYPYRKSEPKKNIGKEIPCTTRPDADNLLKNFFDVLTRLGYWVDDSIITDLHFRKIWCDNPRIELEIEEV